MKEERKEQSDIISLERFANILYSNYIVGPVIQEKTVLTENQKQNHQGVLEKWKEVDPEKYQQGLAILANIQQLASDPEGLKAFLKRKAAKVPILENLRLYALGEEEKDFSGLENESLITNSNLDPATAQVLKMKYGKKLTLVSGKDEYYMEKPRLSISIVNESGERMVISEIGTLNYHTWAGVKDFIPCYEITKQKNGQEQITTVFTRLQPIRFDDSRYLELVADHLLADDHLLLQNYGGYIGELEKASRVPTEDTISIEGEEEEKGGYCIYYDATALSAVKLFERQIEKEKPKREDPNIGENGESR